MNPLSFAEIWKYVGPLAGAILGFIGNYLLERRREGRKRSESLHVVECVELVNAKIFDAESLGPIARNVQIKVPKFGTESELVDVHEIYHTPVSKLRISPKKDPPPFWFGITEGEGQSSPDWEQQLEVLLKEEEALWKRRKKWVIFPIPYLNPYSSTGHEAFVYLSSYEPLSEVEMAGDAEGIKFVFKKSSSIT
jgi:hypothetical protein